MPATPIVMATGTDPVGWGFAASLARPGGMVLYRSHLHKSLKRNYQLMPEAQWLELLCRHIPDRFEHLCPKCKGPMQVIALIDDPAVVRRILMHLHLWSPVKRIKRFIPARGPPHLAPECAQRDPLNEFTYYPVPDIA